MQMSSTTIATNTVCTNIADLLAYSTMVYNDRRNDAQRNIVNREIFMLIQTQANTI